MLARLLVSLLALSSVLLGVSAQDPETYCSPVTIESFELSGSSSEGTELGSAVGIYPTFLYSILVPAYSQQTVFFNVLLHANVTAASQSGLQAYGFTIALKRRRAPGQWWLHLL